MFCSAISGGLVSELLSYRLFEWLERKAHVSENGAECRDIAHDLGPADIPDDLGERHGHEAETLRVQTCLRGGEVFGVEDHGRAVGELVGVQTDRVVVERHQDVGREHVALDRVLAHTHVVGVVATLDERRVLRDVEDVEAGLSEHPRQRLAGRLDAETGWPADPQSKLASSRS